MPYEKVGKNEPVCIADEVPFEIPESWEWVRLGSIGETNIGLTYKPSDKVDEKNGIAVLRSNNIHLLIFFMGLYENTPIPVPVFLRQNKLLYVKWAREWLHQPKIPHFLKMAGIFANKSGVETHARLRLYSWRPTPNKIAMIYFTLFPSLISAS